MARRPFHKIFFVPTLALLFSGLGCRSDIKGSVRITHDGPEYTLALDGERYLRFSVPELAGCGLPRVEVGEAEEEGGWRRVRMTWDVPAAVAQDELSVRFDLDFEPDFWWAPHLAPKEGYVVGQHVFRSPALIAGRGPLTVVVVPDLDIVGKRPGNPWFMDYDAPQRKMWLGLVKTDIPEHVLFKKTPGMTFASGKVELGFFIAAYNDRAAVRNPWSKAAGFLWKRWGRPLFEKGEPIAGDLQSYVRRTFDWAFEGWGRHVWQEFDLGGVRVGAPQFIVNISQSPNYPGPWYQREFLSIWNQAWFSSLRSASGLYRYARGKKDEGLMHKARLTKELALAAPMTDGLFPAVFGTANDIVEIEGKKLRRPRGWDEARWTNSDRTPDDHGITPDWFHVLDSSWTALLMLRWHEELEKDARLLDYARAYGERLLTLQDADGFFPGWLHPETHAPGPVMNQTPETSLSVTFLLKLAELTGEAKFREAAIRAMDAVLAGVVPQGLWLDFETYWSCCGWGREKYLGRKIERNAMHKQNTFSMFWTSEALLAAYRATGRASYLAWGRRTLDELSMAQQVWQPPFIYVPALGGFGVMNADGEWNDSRETLFAELFLDYSRETGEPAYFERGVAALKAGFVMMYCPENPAVKAMWEKVYPWFGPEDYGFTMENYGHGGRTSPEGEGMGVFTIYDWGNGAAAEAAMRILDHYGPLEGLAPRTKSPSPPAPAPGQHVVGIEELTRLDLLPRLKQSVKVGLVSSYDRSGGNDDGFSGKYSFIRKETGGLVIADLEGPGVITRIHTPTPTDDVVEFYFDGEAAPRISLKITDLYDGTHVPFLAPLVVSGVGGHTSYVPLTYRKSCKILVKAETFQFYDINYATYPPDFDLPTYENPPSAEFLRHVENAAKLLDRTGSDITDALIPPGAALSRKSVQATLAPGGSVTLFKTSAPGRILGLKLAPAAAFTGADRDILIRMYWDGAAKPAVNCPVGDFFGYSFGDPAVRSLLLGTTDDGENYIYFPMPFAASARVELVSERAGGAAVGVRAEVVHAPLGKAADEGRFYARWRRENPCTEGQPYTYLRTTGRGHVVGVILQAQGVETGNTGFFEGDDRAVIDGEMAIFGTGSEDSFNGGWYDVPGRWEKRTSLPLSGCLDYKKPLARTGGYRFFLTDSYAYSKSIAYTIEHGPEGNAVPTDYASVVFFYSQDPPPADPPLPPAAERRVTGLDRIIFVPGWNVPIHTTSLQNAVWTKLSSAVGKGRVRYFSMKTNGEDVFGPHHVSFICDLPEAGRYKVSVKAVLGPDQGILRLFERDRPAGEAVNLYAAERTVSDALPLGIFEMRKGDNIIYLHLVGADPRSKGLGFDLAEIIFERMAKSSK